MMKSQMIQYQANLLILRTPEPTQEPENPELTPEPTAEPTQPEPAETPEILPTLEPQESIEPDTPSPIPTIEPTLIPTVSPSSTPGVTATPTTTPSVTPSTDKTIFSLNDQEESQNLTEIVEERTENSKTYDLGEGIYKTDVYMNPIHRKIDGQYVEINTNLDSGISLLSEEGQTIIA